MHTETYQEVVIICFQLTPFHWLFTPLLEDDLYGNELFSSIKELYLC